MTINFVNLKTGEIRQVKYEDKDKYEALFLALRRKNIQEMIREVEGLRTNIILDDLAIEFIE